MRAISIKTQLLDKAFNNLFSDEEDTNFTFQVYGVAMHILHGSSWKEEETPYIVGWEGISSWGSSVLGRAGTLLEEYEKIKKEYGI